MEINNEEIVLYIYHMNKAGPVRLPGPGRLTLCRAALPGRNHPAAGRSLMLAYPERQPWKALLPGLPLASFFHQPQR